MALADRLVDAEEEISELKELETELDQTIPIQDLAAIREIVEKEHHGYHEVAWMWCTHAACVLIRDHT